MPPHVILGVHITDRVKNVPSVQALFTEFGCHIRTRLGLHDVEANPCGPSGLVLLELVGDRSGCDELARRLAAIDGIEVQRMVFERP